jgi:hypothetical protein
MAPGLTLASPGLITRGLGTSPLVETTTLVRVLTLMTRVTTHLENVHVRWGRPQRNPQ